MVEKFEQTSSIVHLMVLLYLSSAHALLRRRTARNETMKLKNGPIGLRLKMTFYANAPGYSLF